MISRMIGGVALIIVGLILFVLGMNAADSLSERFVRFFTGNFTDDTIWLMLMGILFSMAGVTMLVLSRKREALEA